MDIAPDLLVDRRKLRRQLTLWRVLAIGIAVLAVVIGGLVLGRGKFGVGGPHIARIKIEGLITGNQETLDLIQSVEKSAASALVLRISSGGGTTSGSEALYQEVRRLGMKKPVVAVIDGVGASGAYMTALGAERIFSNGSALVGSIGVIAQYPNFSQLLETIGVKVEAVRSTPLKAIPNGLEVTPPEARAALQETVLDTYRWFRGLVGERRNFDEAALNKVADGRVFTGRQALELRLIDELGGEREAIAWLESTKQLPVKLPVINYKPPESLGSIASLTSLAKFFGVDATLPVQFAAKHGLGRNAIDGLVSLWQPPVD